MKFLKNVKTDEFMATVTRTASKYGYKLKKASPTIMIFGAAIVGVAATVSACKATVKARDILENHNEMVKAIHETKEKVDSGEMILKEGAAYTENDYKKDLTTAYVQTGLKLAKIYVPTRMLGASNDFYNFMLDSYYIFKKEDGVSLKRAWAMYDTYNQEAKVSYPYSRRAFREELMNYFSDYKERAEDMNGERVRSYYSGFKYEKFKEFLEDPPPGDDAGNDPPASSWIELKEQHSLFNDICKDCLAQYANENGTPLQKWENVKTRLTGIDTKKLHYVKVPENHIVIDFDIPGPDGSKSFERNLEAASKWPKTYAELSKSGAGIHLHYIYTGDPAKLSRIYDENIEIKVFTGKSSLRRKLSKCNDISIANISSGLPLKGEKAMVDVKQIQNEKHLRILIKKALAKEISPYTKPSVDFMSKRYSAWSRFRRRLTPCGRLYRPWRWLGTTSSTATRNLWTRLFLS